GQEGGWQAGGTAGPASARLLSPAPVLRTGQTFVWLVGLCVVGRMRWRPGCSFGCWGGARCPLRGEAPGTCSERGGPFALVEVDGTLCHLLGSGGVACQVQDLRQVERAVTRVPRIL